MQVVVNCDDVGMHELQDDAAMELLQEGIVRSLSLMACGDSFYSAIEKMHRFNINQAGVHLSLIGEPDFPLTPVSNKARVGTLISASGKLYNEVPPNPTQHYSMTEIALELESQILKVIQSNIEVTHLDGHRFFYEYSSCGPAVYDIVRGLAQKYAVPFRSLSNPADRAVKTHCYTWDEGWNSQQRFRFYTDQLTSSNRPDSMEILIHPSPTRSTSVTFSSPMRHDDYTFFKNLAYTNPKWLQSIDFCSWADIGHVGYE